MIPEHKKIRENNLTYRIANYIAIILKPCSTMGWEKYLVLKE